MDRWQPSSSRPAFSICRAFPHVRQRRNDPNVDGARTHRTAWSYRRVAAGPGHRSNRRLLATPTPVFPSPPPTQPGVVAPGTAGFAPATDFAVTYIIALEGKLHISARQSLIPETGIDSP